MRLSTTDFRHHVPEEQSNVDFGGISVYMSRNIILEVHMEVDHGCMPEAQLYIHICVRLIMRLQ